MILLRTDGHPSAWLKGPYHGCTHAMKIHPTDRPNLDTDDRWAKPLEKYAGQWLQQLPGKYLSLAARGHLPELQDLIATHPDLLNRRGAHGRTFLFEAIRKNRVDTVNWLLEQGADIDLTGCYNIETIVQLNPLSAARWYGRPELADKLIALGAVNDPFRAAFNNELSALEAFLDEDPDLINAEDPKDPLNYTPLISFSVAGYHSRRGKKLLQLGASIQCYSFQLLFIAALRGNHTILKLLLEHGASPLRADARLWMASNDLSILKLLVASGLSANQRDYHGLSPLAYAARGDKGSHPDKLRLLLSEGAVINQAGAHDRTALHYAARAGFTEVVGLLLQAGANKKLVDDQGRTAYDEAVLKRKLDCAQLLKPA